VIHFVNALVVYIWSMSRDDPQMKIRIPATLKAEIDAAALSAQRTMNAEIVHRLTQSFTHVDVRDDLPNTVKMAVQDEMEERGGTFMEALTRLVLAAQSGGGTLFFLKVARGVTTGEVWAAMEASKVVIPPDASIVMERGN
jgi:hypothetical protein